MARNSLVRVSEEDIALILKVREKLYVEFPERTKIPRGEAINQACKHYLGIDTEKPQKEMVKLF